MDSNLAPGILREQRFTQWVQEYGDAILRTCFVYLSNYADAEDAMQDTFIKAWKHMGQYEQRNGANEKTWLIKIAINVCRDYHRSKWFRRVDTRKALEDLPPRFTSIDLDEMALTMEVMKLPEKLKQVTLLYYYHDMTLQEIAEALGIAASTAHRRLKKAEDALKIMLTGGKDREKQSCKTSAG